jgi:hypothetical protein
MTCCKRIVALKMKCQECGREMDYVCDAKYWETGPHTEKESYGIRVCYCKHKMEVTKESALKHIFVKEGAVLG